MHRIIYHPLPRKGNEALGPSFRYLGDWNALKQHIFLRRAIHPRRELLVGDLEVEKNELPPFRLWKRSQRRTQAVCI
jgi:hypothetical protein